MAADSRFHRHLNCWAILLAFYLFSGCATTFYKTELNAEQKAVLCDYSVPWDRQECLDQANQQLEWCKEALGQEDDCWNTLLGDYARYRQSYNVSDSQYFEFLHDPIKIKPLLTKIKSVHRMP